jgi:hypothetical protein
MRIALIFLAELYPGPMPAKTATGACGAHTGNWNHACVQCDGFDSDLDGKAG